LPASVWPLASHLSQIGGRLIVAPTEGWLLMRAGEDTRPYADAGTVLFSSQGPVPDRPARIRTGSVGSSKPGAEIEPHQRQFLHPQGPVARRKFRPTTQILRAGNFV